MNNQGQTSNVMYAVLGLVIVSIVLSAVAIARMPSVSEDVATKNDLEGLSTKSDVNSLRDRISSLESGMDDILEALGAETARISVTSVSAPADVMIGDMATVSATVTNTGGKEGTKTLDLVVNGEVTKSRQVTVAPRETKTVTFKIIKDQEGTYTLNVGGATGLLQVEPAPDGWTGGDELVVWEWGVWQDEEFWMDFKEQHPDVEVKFQTFASNDEVQSKLAAGGRFDVSHFGAALPMYLNRYKAQDAIAPVKSEWVPRYETVYDFFKTNYVEHDTFRWNDKPYMLPTDWGTTSMIYHEKMLENAGLEPPTSWSCLWDEEYTETVGVAMWDAPSEIGPQIMLGLGYTPEEIKNPTDDMIEEFETTVQKCFERATVIYTNAYESYQYLGRKETGIAICWDEAYAYGRDEGIPIGYAGISEESEFEGNEGYITWVTGFVVGKRTMTNGRYKLAHDFINAWLSPEEGRGGVFDLNTYYYASTNSEVQESPHANQEIIELMGLDDPQEKLAKGYAWSEVMPSATVWDKYTDAWVKAKTKAGV
ncbi:hypothetical protein AKJ50_01100 [candidate division MSBL1 archaeon SCGC-AAA382A13]|uniref:CARDB domain-containing protein n=1 Tax=candidate division MSBL1 archaeon SCGC-AAA382A13 TaxID=1698279 RepID=A0A133VG12_9EURY|nr:hypothetical protein AKJ50_01100 [candidate division MSBL1 archaeon SCGC-AAA382A13]